MKFEKTLPITMENKTYVKKDTGATVEYTEFCVIVNGIPLAFKLTDMTARRILSVALQK